MIELLRRADVADRSDVDQIPEQLVDEHSQIVLFGRKGYDRKNLREIGVGRRSRQQFQILIAAVRIAIKEPGTFANAFAEPLFLEQVLKRKTLAAAAHNGGVGGIRAGSFFRKPHGLATSRRAMHDPAPADVLQMALFASANETDRRHVALLAVIERVFPAPLEVEVLPRNEPAAPIGRSRAILDALADEPTWKGRRENARRLPGSIAVAYWRRTKREAFFWRKPVLILEQAFEPLAQSRFRNRLKGVRPHFPIIESGDDHRARREVNHRAWAESRDELALSLRVFRHWRSSAFAMGDPLGSRTLSKTPTSTSRIERPQRKCRCAGRRLSTPASSG